MTLHGATIFDAFNARALVPSEVARTFVPSDAFNRLTRSVNSVVVGPRGSGKTTLLKMLQPSALNSWTHPRADAVRNEIGFAGVFVPFDRVWKGQLSTAVESDATRGTSDLGRAAFTTQVFRSLVQTMHSRLGQSVGDSVANFGHVALEPSKHEELARRLQAIWMLDSTHLSLGGVRSALGERLSTIGALGIRATRGARGTSALQVPDDKYLTLPLLTSVSAALDVWQEIVQTDEMRWGFLFDELELAPAEITRELMLSLRSTDHRLLFKLALSPFDDAANLGVAADSAQPGHDYEPIALWPTSKHAPLQFCQELWETILRERKIAPAKPFKIFGRSSGRRASRTAEEGTYVRGSRRSREFLELALRDESFKRYLEDHHLDATRLDSTPPASRDAHVRKIAPLVEARLFFLRQSHGSQDASTRSRKRLTLYAGWENLCAISEGNPRWFKGMVGDMLTDHASGSLNRVPMSVQAAVIERTAERFLLALQTFPTSKGALRRSVNGISDLLNRIGTYLHERQMMAPFSAEPVGTFVLDDHAYEDFLFPVGQAINSGAVIVAEDGNVDGLLASLVGTRLRLSYLLAAHYRMIPRLGRAVKLSTVLRTSGSPVDDLELKLGL